MKPHPLTDTDQSCHLPPTKKLRTNQSQADPSENRQFRINTENRKKCSKPPSLIQRDRFLGIMAASVIKSPNKDRLLPVSSPEWRKQVKPVTQPWEELIAEFIALPAQIKRSRIGLDIQKYWMKGYEIRLAGAIGLSMRVNDETTKKEIWNGIKTVRRLYRAHCRQLENLCILYKGLGNFRQTDYIMLITIVEIHRQRKNANADTSDILM